MHRLKINFTGRVQGVGFRYTTMQIAAQHEVTGYVKNLSNGSVLVAAEGTQAHVSSFLDSIQERMSGYIDNYQIVREQATGEFTNFTIGY